ncbi:MAG: pirin family protein [Bacteroidota bacterium]
MDRKNFIKKTLLGAAGLAAGSQAVNATSDKSTFDKLMVQVGFNHLPNKEFTTMKTVYHPANSRGHANHGWLDSHHTFSFANYYNPDRMNFGVLRVLNDDVVAPSRGFGKHPHDNMEIISIPLAGDLEHKDSMGNSTIIKQGDVQVMSAGTGVFHSEYNKNSDKEVRFLQIWMFPNKKGVTPRYDQITVDGQMVPNQFNQILSPNPDDAGVWVHQDAWFHMGEFAPNQVTTYHLKKSGNGVYAFIIEGEVTIGGDQKLGKRDGFGMWDLASFDMTASSDAKVLLMEVPMALA